MIASSSRDRTVQLLSWRPCTTEYGPQAWRLEILQTLDEHVSAVTGVCFSSSGDKLISMSSDRTIVIRLAAMSSDRPNPIFIPLRTIMLKTTPLAIDVDDHMTNTLLASTIDRQVLTFDLTSGDRTGSFRTSEADGGESVILNAIGRISMDSKSVLIAGGSSADKSVRLYDASGRLLARDYGHTESITGVLVITKPGDATTKTLVTAASDGTIFMWNLSGNQSRSQLDTREEASMSDIMQRTSSFHLEQAPVRRVVNSSEIARLRAATADPESPVTVVHPRTPSKHSVRPNPRQAQISQEGDARPLSTPTTQQGHRPLLAAQARRLHIKAVATTPSSPTTPRHGNKRTPAPASATFVKSQSNGNKVDATLEDAVEETCTVLRKFRSRLAQQQSPDGASADRSAISLDLVRELRREVAALEQALPRPSGLFDDVDASASTAAGAHDIAMLDDGDSTRNTPQAAQLPHRNGEALT